MTSLSFNVNIAQTGFPIPPLKRNTLKDLEQEVLSYDKLYLNLRGKNLVPDCSDTGGLWLLSQNLKNVIPHSVAAALGPHFHFAQCRQMEEFSGCAKRKKKQGEEIAAVSVIQNQVSLFAGKLAYPLQRTGEVRSNHFTPINQS